MIYAISDIHGSFDDYRRILCEISFKPTDTLYVLGDVVDRGAEGIRILQDMMDRPNVVPILGNHELMMAVSLKLLNREITEESVAKLGEAEIGALADWFANGGEPTLRAFNALSQNERLEVMEYLWEFSLYEEVRAGGREYVLVHAGIDNFSPERPLEDYDPADFLEGRSGPTDAYWPDRTVVSGHTPTRLIPGNPAPDRIYKIRGRVCIDCGCGCGFGGTLGALCLDTGEEFYA